MDQEEKPRLANAPGTTGEVLCRVASERGKDEPKALGELGAKPFRGGEENRAKDAKDAKVKGMEGN